MSNPIPPRGQSRVALAIEEVPHGWRMSIDIKNLARSGSPSIPSQLYPYVVLWTHISQILDAANMDLHDALDNMPQRTDET